MEVTDGKIIGKIRLGINNEEIESNVESHKATKAGELKNLMRAVEQKIYEKKT